MRKLIGALVCSVLCVSSIVGPVSAATTETPQIAQATAASGTLTGTVITNRGVGLANAQVNVSNQVNTFSSTTDAKGQFSIAVPAGIYSIIVNKGGYQSYQADGIAVAPSSQTKIVAGLNEADLGSLKVIGRASSNTVRNPINNSVSATTTITPDVIVSRNVENLTDLVGTLPGVTISRTFSSTPNTNFVVRGAGLQTKVNIDGHPVSSGIGGQWNTNYAASGIFNSVEVLKGAGLNGPTAGESAVGTVNLRTRDFSAQNSGALEVGTDSFNGGVYNAFVDVNLLNNRLSLLAEKQFNGYNGPYNNYFADRIGSVAGVAPGTGQVPFTTGLDQWQGDFTYRYSLEAELVKARYRLSNTTSVTASFLGLQGQYQPQGGSYATYLGNVTLAACQSKAGVFQPTLATCDTNATYNPPYAAGNIGNTVQGYQWFPNSVLQNNEPQFSAELRTAYKNDTILFRPYTALINRFIDGNFENRYPGNSGGWNVVTDAANCKVAYGPAASGGFTGPCFMTTSGPTSGAYIGSDTTPVVFGTTNVRPTCSPTPPYTCFTTKTGQQVNGQFGFGTPFSQSELDRLHGYTFSYIHPVADNIYNFSYDYNSDYTTSNSNDSTVPPSGCTATVGGGTNLPVSPGFQSTCPLPFLPRSNIGTPPTQITKNDFSLTAQLQLNPKLNVVFGNYLTIYKAQPQVEDPALLQTYAKLGTSGAAPVQFVTNKVNIAHYDPHFGLTYRFNNDAIVRATAGSSITTPYAGLISGFGSVNLPNQGNPSYIVNLPNPSLQPETTVAYDVGADFRVNGGTLISVDAYDNTVHNVFLSNITTIPLPVGVTLLSGGSSYQSQQINGPIYRAYGIEATIAKTPAIGFGYLASGTLQRAFNDQLPLSIYANGSSNFLINYKQFGIPYAKGYGEVRYAGEHNSLITFGADYEGSNNSTYGPAYTIFNSTLRFDVAPQTSFQMAVENLFNLNTGTALGRALSNQGAIEPTVKLVNGVLVYGGSTSPIQALPFRTARFTLTRKF